MADDDIYGIPLSEIQGKVKAALDPDVSKFYKAHLGEDGPSIGDHLFGDGRFAKARGLRDEINNLIMKGAIEYMQRPTVGDAQAIHPNFPTPANARVNIPGQAAPVEGLDTFSGRTEQSTSPSRMQGPMPGVHTPLGAQVLDDLAMGRTPFDTPIAREYGRAEPTMFQEGPRPADTVHTTGVYEPEVMPTMTKGVDLNTKLPAGFNEHYKALEHQAGLRAATPRTALTAAELDASNQMRYQALKTGSPEAYPGETDFYGHRLGMFDKEKRPGTPGASIEENNATITGAKAANASTRETAETADIRARTAESQAKAKESTELLSYRIAEMVSKTNLNDISGQTAVQKGELAELRVKLGIDEMTWKVIKSITAAGDLDPASRLAGIQSVLSSDPNLKARMADPNWIQSILGIKPTGIQIESKDTPAPLSTKPVPKAEAPALTPPKNQGPGEESPEDKAASAKRDAAYKKYQQMKEGEVADIDGVKMQKKGGKLKPVKE